VREVPRIRRLFAIRTVNFMKPGEDLLTVGTDPLIEKDVVVYLAICTAEAATASRVAAIVHHSFKSRDPVKPLKFFVALKVTHIL
jgi:hypothetical protein